MERAKIVRRDGSVSLVGHGPAGAVSLDAWRYEGRPMGILGIHLACSAAEGALPSACEYLPGGLCYPDLGFRAGIEAAPLVLAGDQDDLAWAVVEDWYASRVAAL